MANRSISISLEEGLLAELDALGANRSALVRVPMYTPRKASSRRIEVRSPDSACNPYLAFAVLLAAGLRGIEKGYELGPQAEDNVWNLTPEERIAMGYKIGRAHV